MGPILPRKILRVKTQTPLIMEEDEEGAGPLQSTVEIAAKQPRLRTLTSSKPLELDPLEKSF